MAARLKGREEGAFKRKLPVFKPLIHVDNESSRRYTILEIVAENAMGLLFRVSRAMSESAGIRLNPMSIRDKLAPAAQAEVLANLQRVLEGRP